MPDDAMVDGAPMRCSERSSVDGRGILVVSDDLVIRGGLVAILGSAGVAHRTVSLERLAVLDLAPWGTVLVWIEYGDGADAFATVQRCAQLGADVTGRTRLVAVHARELPAIVRLRLVEAGFRSAVPLAELTSRGLGAEPLGEALLRPHLLEPAALLRAGLGLAPHGRLGDLLRDASAVPAGVWTSGRAQADLPLRRREVESLRRAALAAGVRLPRYEIYACSTRAAPTLPLWRDVREVVRAAWGLDR